MPGHHAHGRPPAKVRYEVTGISTVTAPTSPVTLSGVKYHPKTLGTSATLGVNVDTTTKFANRHGKAIAEASIKTGDRIEALWVEPSGTTPSLLLTATKIIDRSIR